MASSIPPEANRARQILAVLDSDKRLRLLAILYNRGERMSFRELSEAAGLSGSNLAQHVDPLVQTGLALNTYHPSDGREYSFYEISPMGREWLRKVELVDSETDTAWLAPA